MIRRYSSSSCKRLTALGLTLLAVISPLVMDRMRRKSSLAEEIEELEQAFSLSSYLPLILLVLSVAIVFSACRHHSFWNRFDPYWIHRAVGSSFGIVFFLVVLAFVLRYQTAESSQPNIEREIQRMEDEYIERAIVWLEGLSKGTDTHELETIALTGLSVDHAEKGLVRCKLAITEIACNADGNWNAGAIAILIDDICAAAICTVIGQIKLSVDFSISYYSQAKIGDEVEIEAKVVAHSGKLSSAVVNVMKCAAGGGSEVQIVAMAKQWMISVIRPNLYSKL